MSVFQWVRNSVYEAFVGGYEDAVEEIRSRQQPSKPVRAIALEESAVATLPRVAAASARKAK